MNNTNLCKGYFTWDYWHNVHNIDYLYSIYVIGIWVGK